MAEKVVLSQEDRNFLLERKNKDGITIHNFDSLIAAQHTSKAFNNFKGHEETSHKEGSEINNLRKLIEAMPSNGHVIFVDNTGIDHEEDFLNPVLFGRVLLIPGQMPEEFRYLQIKGK